ncbi:MAG: oligopeptide/dipeptide ABC transporter ATP-binding protein, partial [Pseudomonadota bacterium]
SAPAAARPGEALRPIPGAAPTLAAVPSGCAFKPRCDRAVDACAQPALERALSPRRAHACLRPLL